MVNAMEQNIVIAANISAVVAGPTAIFTCWRRQHLYRLDGKKILPTSSIQLGLGGDERGGEGNITSS